jgi:phosphoribosyl 1,2-cyclic phosphodiesterase
MEAGADEFLVKPISIEHLLELLNTRTRPATQPVFPARNEGMNRGCAPFVRFWGVRGSVPVPGPDTLRYGGNTACVEFRAGDKILILDAGTGIRPLSEALASEFGGSDLELTLLLTHAHWDHIQGFPFFKAVYEPSCHLQVLGFDPTGEGLTSVFARPMETPYFPIRLHQLPAQMRFEEVSSMDFHVGPIRVQAAFVNHPGVCVGYRLSVDGFSAAYVPDHEPFHRTCLKTMPPGATREQTAQFAAREDERIVEFLSDVDVLILDSQFDPKEYPAYIGWGHSSVDDAVALAIQARAARLFLFHHSPTHTDEDMDRMEQHARKLAAESGSRLDVAAAREGATVELLEHPPHRTEKPAAQPARKKP